MKRKILLIIMPIILIVLEILPYGAVLNFSNQQEGGSFGTIRQTTSYFDLLPFGYANFGPFLTAVLSCTILLMTLFYLKIQRKNILNTIFMISIIAFLTSVMPLMFGLDSYSIVGALISICIIIEACIVKRTSKII